MPGMLSESRARRGRGQAGLTLLELVLAAAIMAILAAAAMPLMSVSVQRSREVELRRGLRMLRRAIDDFHMSYVASGGSTSQGPTSLPGRASAPGTASNVQPSRPLGGGSSNRPTGPSGAAGGRAAGPGRRQQEIQLIDISEFDPIDSKGYPPTLQILVEGVQAFGGVSEDPVRFLRRIPRDPFLSATDIDESDENHGWGVRSYQDDLDASVWGRQNVYDVYTKSGRRALDGSMLRDW